MRRFRDVHEENLHEISIHAPLTGCDKGDKVLILAHRGISIHAPLTGCDNQTLMI